MTLKSTNSSNPAPNKTAPYHDSSGEAIAISAAVTQTEKETPDSEASEFTATPTETATEVASETTTEVTRETPGNAPSEDSTPGFGLLGALGALGSTAAYLYRRTVNSVAEEKRRDS